MLRWIVDENEQLFSSNQFVSIKRSCGQKDHSIVGYLRDGTRIDLITVFDREVLMSLYEKLLRAIRRGKNLFDFCEEYTKWREKFEAAEELEYLRELESKQTAPNAPESIIPAN